MNWDEDIDFMAGRKVTATQGRRAGSMNSPNKSDDSIEGSSSPPEALMHTRKTGKWAEEDKKSGKRKNSTNIIELERFQTEKPESDDDDIPVIPDIEDFQDEISSPVETHVLKSQGFKSTYKEIDSELVKLETTQKFVNKSKIDLSLLTSRLIPEKDVKETDDIWTIESLFESIMSSINK